MMKKVFGITLIFFALSAAPGWAETYEKWVSKCKSYKDVAHWLSENSFSDREGSDQGLAGQKFISVKNSKETFRSKTGLSLEAAVFAKHTLNRINPDYRAEIIYLFSGRFPVHYVCGFYLGGKLFIMDYGNPNEKMMGTHGPYENLDEYVRKFYLKGHSHLRKLQSYDFGWPPWSSPKQR